MSGHGCVNQRQRESAKLIPPPQQMIHSRQLHWKKGNYGLYQLNSLDIIFLNLLKEIFYFRITNSIPQIRAKPVKINKEN
ncbi:hypothetical protein VNO77_41644 [Canavalia gladiata]|uniref:Uncharacterized protein n=1 Tax=Canavalia gladiata TaxID=3824 RepID=A0AAN9K198_CANGL